jgi:hypothetical protein
MSKWAVLALRAIIAIALAGSLVVQLAMAPVLWFDMNDAPVGVRVSLAVIGILGVACLQVIGICIWKLLTLIRRGTVFAARSFRYVDGVIYAISTGAILVFAIAVVARFANHSAPGDEVAPGLVGLICGGALVVGGVALVVYVLRVLLAQAVALHREATNLRSELDEVI